MIVIPSVDVEKGRVVKRVQGVKGSGLIIGRVDDVIRRFLEARVEMIHVVDLDGTEKGEPVNLDVVKSLVDQGFRIQFGGGVRREKHVDTLFKLGVEAVVLGTALFTNPSLVKYVIKEYGARSVVAALDARHGVVLVSGWRKEAKNLLDALDHVVKLGVVRLLYTAVEREGLMQGPNLEAVKVLRGRFPGELQYAGGVSNIHDIEVLAELGVNAVIVGMAFYTGALDLTEAVLRARRV